MKVVKKGSNRNWWLGKQVTCDLCFAVLVLESEDKVKEYRNECGVKIYFTCCECGKENSLYF